MYFKPIDAFLVPLCFIRGSSAVTLGNSTILKSFCLHEKERAFRAEFNGIEPNASSSSFQLSMLVVYSLQIDGLTCSLH